MFSYIIIKMSVSSIVGNTADDVDAKKVPWAY